MNQTKSRQKPQKPKRQADHKWTLFVLFFSFLSAALMYMLSDRILSALNVYAAAAILLLIVAVGIVFDIIGVAVTTASEEPFHSMAARKQAEGVRAVKLIRRATRVSSFCNDVVGDIAGVVSGATAAAIAVSVFSSDFSFWGKMLMTALVSAMTVGGKAMGKNYAMRFNKEIVCTLARVLGIFSFARRHKKSGQNKKES